MSDEFSCEFCKKILKNKYTLKYHQTTSKKCLKAQDKKEEEVLENKCNSCLKYFSTKFHLESHIKVCKENIKIKNENLMNGLKDLESVIIKYKNQIKELNEKNKELEKYKSLYQELKTEHNAMYKDYNDILKIILANRDK